MARKLTGCELKSVCLTTESQYHLLKHFIQADQEYLQKLQAVAPYSQQELEMQFREPGSKFLPGFAKNPLHLWNIVAERIGKKTARYPWISDRCEISLIFGKEEYPKGVGTDALVAKSELSPEETAACSRIVRSGYRIEAVKRPCKITRQVNIILTEIQDNILLQAAFPGIYAPPFPDPEKQDSLTYEASRAFWDEHVFCIQ